MASTECNDKAIVDCVLMYKSADHGAKHQITAHSNAMKLTAAAAAAAGEAFSSRRKRSLELGA